MTSTLIGIARELGRGRDHRINANAMIEVIASQVWSAVDDDEIPAPSDIHEIGAIAQSYFDGLAESFGLEAGEIVVRVA